MAARGFISYWWLPVFSSLVWLGMLLGMLLWWLVTVHRRRLPSVEPDMTLPYISDIGAFDMKPLFIAGACVTTVSFDLAFAAERWLRHRGRLVPNTSVFEKVLVGLTIVFAIVGTVGLVCLSIFDTYRHNSLHDIFLVLFIGGYMLSAVVTCWEYQRLGVRYRTHRVLRASFWIKLSFVLVELSLAIAFAVVSTRGYRNVAAYLEWTVAFIFTLYILSFVIDLWPARLTKSRSRRYRLPSPEMAENGLAPPPRAGPSPGNF